jgi:hypothetical protein
VSVIAPLISTTRSYLGLLSKLTEQVKSEADLLEKTTRRKRGGGYKLVFSATCRNGVKKPKFLENHLIYFTMFDMAYTILSFPALSLLFLTRTILAALPFGHYGPEGTVLYLNGFHFVSGHTDWEISANHFCTIVSDDLLQCAVYNTATSPTHLAGVEYIITTKAFETLPWEGM